MFGEMTTQFLPAPLVDAGDKTFKVTLKNTPNISAATAEWLGDVAKEGLGENQVHALVLALRHNSVSNADLRDATGVDTLTASRVLVGLRDRGLLEMRDQGSLAFYVLSAPAKQAAAAASNATPAPPDGPAPARPSGDQGVLFPELAADAGGLRANAGGLGPDAGGLGPDAGGLAPDAGGQPLPPDLERRVRELSPKARTEAVRGLIRELCALRPFTARQLASLLRRKNVRHLAEEHLAEMVKGGVLERTIPDNPTHPQQAFRTKRAT